LKIHDDVPRPPARSKQAVFSGRSFPTFVWTRVIVIIATLPKARRPKFYKGSESATPVDISSEMLWFPSTLGVTLGSG
jgi:hypothetical protein